MNRQARIALGVLAAIAAFWICVAVLYDPDALIWHDDTGKGRTQAQAEAELTDVCHLTERSADAEYCMNPRGWSVDDSHDGSSGPANAGLFGVLFGILPLSLLLALCIWLGPRWLRVPAIGVTYVLGAFTGAAVVATTLASLINRH